MEESLPLRKKLPSSLLLLRANPISLLLLRPKLLHEGGIARDKGGASLFLLRPRLLQEYGVLPLRPFVSSFSTLFSFSTSSSSSCFFSLRKKLQGVTFSSFSVTGVLRFLSGGVVEVQLSLCTPLSSWLIFQILSCLLLDHLGSHFQL